MIFLFASAQTSCRQQYSPVFSELLCPSVDSKKTLLLEYKNLIFSLVDMGYCTFRFFF